MSNPLPFTRENVLSWVGDVLTGLVAGLIMVALAYLVVDLLAEARIIA